MTVPGAALAMESAQSAIEIAPLRQLQIDHARREAVKTAQSLRRRAQRDGQVFQEGENR